MDIKILPKKKSEKIILPEVGQYWKHESFHEIYRRISDADGRKVLYPNGGEPGTDFYSVMVSTKLPTMHRTGRNCDDLIILEIEEPLNFRII